MRKSLKSEFPDITFNREEKIISRTTYVLYKKFKLGNFNLENFPVQGKKKPNGHQVKHNKQSMRRSIRNRNQEHPHYKEKFHYLESATIVGRYHKK